MNAFFSIFALVFNIIFWTAFVMIIINISKTRSSIKKTRDFVHQNVQQAFQRKTYRKSPQTNNSIDSHRQQVNYSQRYSMNKTEHKDAIKDAPLSEAEKNVLFGK